MKTIKIIRTIKIWDDNGMCSTPFVFPCMTFKMKFYTIGVRLPPLTPILWCGMNPKLCQIQIARAQSALEMSELFKSNGGGGGQLRDMGRPV